jgi:hypothetical protein
VIRLAILAGTLATLTVRILLLLSGFLPAALLLTRLLPGVLVLLAGILVLIGHCDLPFSKSQETTVEPAFGCAETWVPAPAFPAWSNRGSDARLTKGTKNYLCTSP